MEKVRYLKANMRTMKICAMYPVKFEGIFLNILYKICVLIFTLPFIVVTIQFLWHFLKVPLELPRDAKLVVDGEIYIMLLPNFILINSKRGKMEKLFKATQKFVDETDNNIKVITMKKANKYANFMAYFWMIFILFSATTSSIMPVFSRETPVGVWLPYNYTISPRYELTCVFQYFAKGTMAIVYGVSDVLFPSIALITAQQFKILSCNFRNSFYYSLLKYGVKEESVKEFKQMLMCSKTGQEYKFSRIFKITSTERFQNINFNYLVKNMEHHKFLLRHVDNINDIFYFILFGKVLLSLLYMPFIAFSIITTTDSLIFVTMVTYVMVSFFQIFMFNYFGHLVSMNADILSDINTIPWYLCNKKFKTVFLFLQMRCSKVAVTKAGPFFTLSLPTFVSVLNTVSSYITILYQLTTK